MSNCQNCTAPAAAFLCTTCGLRLRGELADVPSLLADAELARCRQQQFGAPYDRSRGGSDCLPYRPDVGPVITDLHGTLWAWVSTIAPARHCTLGTAELAAWLLRHLDLVRIHQDAGQLLDEVIHAIQRCRRKIDRPSDRRRFLGPCGAPIPTTSDLQIDPESGARAHCAEELYGSPWERTARCPACDAEHDIVARQDWLQRKALGYCGSASEIAGFLGLTGVEVSAAAIRGFAARGRLAATQANQRGHPLYRISDVIVALNSRYQHRSSSVVRPRA